MTEDLFGGPEGTELDVGLIIGEEFKMFSVTVMQIELILIILVGTKTANKLTYFWGESGVALVVIFALLLCFFAYVGLMWSSRTHKNKIHQQFLSISFKVAINYISFLVKVLGTILGTVISSSLFSGEIADGEVSTYLINILIVCMIMSTIQLASSWLSDIIQNYSVLLASTGKAAKANVD